MTLRARIVPRLSPIWPPGPADFYFEIQVLRSTSAYDTTRCYHITVTATDVGLNGISIPNGGTMTQLVGE